MTNILLLHRRGGGRKVDARAWMMARSDEELEVIYKLARVHKRDF